MLLARGRFSSVEFRGGQKFLGVLTWVVYFGTLGDHNYWWIRRTFYFPCGTNDQLQRLGGGPTGQRNWVRGLLCVHHVPTLSEA